MIINYLCKYCYLYLFKKSYENGKMLIKKYFKCWYVMIRFKELIKQTGRW